MAKIKNFMKNEAYGLFIFAFILFTLLVSGAVSASVEIKKQALNDVVIPELKNPAVYSLSIKNLGAEDNFAVYSLVGVSIMPNDTIHLSEGEEKTIAFRFYPNEAILKKKGTLNFVYKVRGDKSGVQEDILLINIVNFKDIFEIGSYNINPESETARVYIRNNVNSGFKGLKVSFKSAFFEIEKTADLTPYGKEEFELILNKDEIKKLVAGTYILSAIIESEGVKESFENTFKFTEKAGIVKTVFA